MRCRSSGMKLGWMSANRGSVTNLGLNLLETIEREADLPEKPTNRSIESHQVANHDVNRGHQSPAHLGKSFLILEPIYFFIPIREL